MGNSNSAIDFEYQITASDYRPVDKIKDPRFGELIQMKHQTTDQVVVMKEKVIKDSETYKKTLEENVNYMALKHRNLVRVYGFAGADSQEKNKARIYIYFEHLPDTLHGEINAKKLSVAQKTSGAKGSSKFFEESSLFKIAAEVVDTLEYLQQNSVSHGEIRPDTCFISKSGSFKIVNRKLVCDATSAFELVKDGDRNCFLTPKAFECIKKGLNEPMEDKYKADVFGLGLTLLECATLKPSSQIYDWNNYTINLTLLSNRLIEVKDRYSASLYNLVKAMIRIDEDQRPDFITLKNQLEEEGWINAYATSSPNFTDEEIAPELGSQVHNKNTGLVQTKGFRDSQLAGLISPDKNSMSLNRNQHMFSNSIFSNRKPQSVKNASMGVRYLHTEENTEDIMPSERVYSANKVPQAIMNRTVGTPKGLMSQSGTTSLQEMMLSRNQLDRPRDTVSSNHLGGHFMNDKIKNKFSKLHGTFSKTSTAQQVPQQAQQSFESSAKLNKTKSIFSDKPEFSKNAPSSTLPDYSIQAEEPSTIMGYQYNYESAPGKREFCVENLLQEALHRSSKHPNLDILHHASQHISKSDKPMHPNSRALAPAVRRPSEKPLGGVSPFGKSKLTINCDFDENEQYGRDNITPFTITIPSPKVIGKEDDCNSEVTYFAPGTLETQGRPEAFISNQNSFLEFESVRASHRPIVVDFVENHGEFNKFLIDSIVKPEAFNTKSQSNVGYSPFSKDKNQAFQPQRTQMVYRAQNEQVRAPVSYSNQQGQQKTFAKIQPQNERIALDTSLEEDIGKVPNEEAYTYSKAISTGEEFASQENNLKQPTRNEPVDEEPLEDLIEKAIQRSRQTYLMTTGGMGANPYSNASESKFSDMLASDNCITNDHVNTNYEPKFAPCSQIQS